MKTNLLKKSVAFIVMLFLMMPVFALNPVATDNGVTPINNNVDKTQTAEYKQSGDAQVPKVSFNTVKNKSQEKLYNIITFLQTIGEPFAIIVFIVGALYSLVCAFSGKGLVNKGLFTMLIAGIMYAGIMYSPQIVRFICGWLIS